MMSLDWEPHDRHWIRLRGPWEVAWVEDDGHVTEARRVILPADWRSLFGDRLGAACFQRTFQQPTGLEPDERVCVTLIELGASVRCRINDAEPPVLPQPLGDPSCWPGDDCVSFDLTDHLRSTNRLELTVCVESTSSQPVGLHRPVLLEIVTVGHDD